MNNARPRAVKLRLVRIPGSAARIKQMIAAIKSSDSVVMAMAMSLASSASYQADRQQDKG